MGKSGQAWGRENDLVAVEWVWRFGWLRPAELGLVMWPGSAHALKMGERLARKIADAGLVIRRTLPEGAGSALVVAEGGARLLREAGIVNARSGKDWGSVSGGTWSPTAEWRHDMLAAGFLALLVWRGTAEDVRPERQISREHPGLMKVPDGLWLSESGHVGWLEVEHSKKAGARYLHAMADSLVSVACGHAPSLCGWPQALAPCVAFPAMVRDSRGHRIDHRLRVSAAIRAAATQDIAMQLVELELNQVGAVIDFKAQRVDIEADAVSHLLRRLRWYQTDAGGATWYALTSAHQAEVAQVGDRWRAQIRRRHDDQVVAQDQAGGLKAAQRAAAALLVPLA
jgi:hypothetical protein